jgi:transposase
MRGMKSAQKTQSNQDDSSHLSQTQLIKLLADEQTKNSQLESRFTEQKACLHQRDNHIQKQDQRILLLEELLRLRKIEKFAASSEKMSFQVSLFDEAELDQPLMIYWIRCRTILSLNRLNIHN